MPVYKRLHTTFKIDYGKTVLDSKTSGVEIPVFAAGVGALHAMGSLRLCRRRSKRQAERRKLARIQ